jgi:BirA family biotin operon repressor/biotin-[acetyl-CoA-carboxylase] ligase
VTTFLARQERFARVGSTNDVVRDWLAGGTAEVCLAIAAEQTSGRGRAGRSWVAPASAALLLSLGFRPTWLEPERAWRLAAVVSLAMAAGAESVAGLPDGTIRLKWPNDLVVAGDAAGVRKLAGVLGETQGLGTDDPRVVVGLGINTDWPAADFPPELAESMTSLREASGGRPIDQEALLVDFLARVELAIEALRAGRFDEAEWASRQVTSGRLIRLERPDRSETVRALGVDALTGALVVEDPTTATGERRVVVGEISHVRLADPEPATAGV